MKPVRRALRPLFLLLFSASSLTPAFAQHTPPGFRARDPGPRPNPKSAIPNPVPNLNANEIALFTESLLRVSELEGTCDTCVQQPQGVLPLDPDPSNPFSPKKLVNSAGMGPVFNADQCFTCHSQPAIGGSAQRKNAAFEVAGRMGANNTVPSFEERNGAFREVRFKFGKNGARDGGVHSLFTLAGRSDVPAACRVQQPDFDREMQERNLAFRIPLQLFGLGLIESIQDSTIRENMRADRDEKRSLGIEGRPNINPNTGTISRFGWKAQNASLTVFAGEAYNVEMGISNDLFPIARNEDPECNKAYEPFDVPRTDAVSYNNPLKIMPAWLMFTEFMRFVDAPQPAPMTASASRGKQLFKEVGCAFCHTPSMQTPGTANPSGQWDEVGAHTVALRGQTVNLYSDLLVHHMGATLADNIVQGNAGPDEFRTTPLWGLGQRIYFLHDGRTSDLMTAIQDHFSFPGFDGGDNPAKDRDSAKYGFSEANGTVSRFNRLPEVDKQSILEFLRAL
ncbi:di-heme oxidoredictase family protein [Terriglobus roseus]|uniref:CxxC motif-containing protein, DUF1111 family n=1 Tax=Terriglobus roseus TaxID=392734 RepID=A0A1H4J6I6_9BACT|nr:di-heme oxidoredictase family protein [Terriglobus roseus]SEB41821.1 CxxC motif-containing protein, DUF1111 family [Terriglobus roseus]